MTTNLNAFTCQSFHGWFVSAQLMRRQRRLSTLLRGTLFKFMYTHVLIKIVAEIWRETVRPPRNCPVVVRYYSHNTFYMGLAQDTEMKFGSIGNNSKNHLVSGLCPSTGILNTIKHTVPETGSVSVFRWAKGNTSSVGSVQKKAKVSQGTYNFVLRSVWI
jgi:hypothetical protein